MSSRLLSPPKDAPGRRLSRSAENLASGGRSTTLPSVVQTGRPASPQFSSTFSKGFKGLFHRKRESDSGHADVPSTGGEGQGSQLSSSASDLHPVSYAGSLQDLPERPSAFNRVLQQIRTRPVMKKPQEGKGSQKGTAARTKSDGSDTEGAPSLATLGGMKEEKTKRLSGGMKLKEEDSRPVMDDTESVGLGRELDTQVSTTPNYGSDMDEVDSSSTPDPQRTKALIEHYLTKIERTKELIKAEQKAKDENVTEYLALAEHADKQQISRIKTVFEKKNTRSNTNMANLQRKLENYQRRLFDLVNYGASGPRKPKEVLQGMHQGLKGVRDNIREGITGFSGGVADKIGEGLSGLQELTHTAASAMVSKPKEFASKFKNKFGSADNLDSINDEDDQNSVGVHNKSKSSWFAPLPVDALHKSASDGDETCSLTSGSGANGHPLLGHDDIEHPLAGAVNKLQRTVQELTANQTRLQQSLEDLQNQLQHHQQYFSQSFQEERYRSERLEEQLTDLTDLHTHAMNNLQQELGSVQERLEYRMEERSRDYIDSVEQCQTRISKIELAQQHQQVITLEGYENANARALLSKFINVILLVLAVILVILSNAVNLVSPLVQTKSRLLITLTIGAGLFYLWQQREMIDGARRNFSDNYLQYLTFFNR
ncbi:transmembrane and coiled-coil domains protein 2-like [Diadema setosum]|uniref:transmembrane and coiled-coil domains protein 2-like n=1 Tax=Diadema setosum TaxID=31175 RepID=UPI003B3B76BB